VNLLCHHIGHWDPTKLTTNRYPVQTPDVLLLAKIVYVT